MYILNRAPYVHLYVQQTRSATLLVVCQCNFECVKTGKINKTQTLKQRYMSTLVNCRTRSTCDFTQIDQDLHCSHVVYISLAEASYNVCRFDLDGAHVSAYLDLTLFRNVNVHIFTCTSSYIYLLHISYVTRLYFPVQD